MFGSLPLLLVLLHMAAVAAVAAVAAAAAHGTLGLRPTFSLKYLNVLALQVANALVLRHPQ